MIPYSQANENYAHVQRQRRNVNLTIEKMEECLPMLANYQKMKVSATTATK